MAKVRRSKTNNKYFSDLPKKKLKRVKYEDRIKEAFDTVQGTKPVGSGSDHEKESDEHDHRDNDSDAELK